MAGLDAVCFDLDGTLCVRDRPDEAIHELLFARVGIDPCWDVEAIYAVDLADLPAVDTTREYWAAFYRLVAAEAGVEDDYAGDLADATVELVVDDPHVSFRDGAEQALRSARECSPVGLVTHGSERAQTAKLERLGIAGAFDATVCCGPTVDCPGKPEPEPFRRALADLDASPARTVHVGDRRGDVEGANAAGLVSVLVPDGEAPEDVEPEPDHVLSSMAEVPDLLRELDGE